MTRTGSSGLLWLLLACAGTAGACEDDPDDSSARSDEAPGSHGESGRGGSPSRTKDAAAAEEDAGEEVSEALRVEIEDGKLEGALSEGGKARAFLGIPYAKPPVGALRWKHAERPEAWSTPRKATQFGGRCAQLASAVLMNAASDNEDCLYLNVWTPTPAPAEKLPVMFWIHGGGNVNGSTSEPVPYVKSGVFYSGEHLAAEKGVVVVTINYRLGVLGFLANDALRDEGSPFGNQGLRDQTFALEWVKRNIAQFGGDPEQVTIYGESAGSLDVCLHVASPKSRGLFQRAISESGGCTTFQTTPDAAATISTALADKLACSGDVLGCMRDKPVTALLDAARSVGEGFSPIVDGEFLPDQPRALFDRGDIAKVPYILGSNTDEGTLFTVGGTPIETKDALRAAVSRSVSAPVEEVLDQYPVDRFKDEELPYQAILARVLGDSSLVCTTYDAAIRHAAAGGDTWMYNFDIPANAGNLGATHGSELVYVFGTASTLSDEQREVSRAIQSYWTNLAKTGDPNGGDLPAWPAFTANKPDRLNFGLEITRADGFRRAECEFWRAQYAKRFQE